MDSIGHVTPNPDGFSAQPQSHPWAVDSSSGQAHVLWESESLVKKRNRLAQRKHRKRKKAEAHLDPNASICSQNPAHQPTDVLPPAEDPSIYETASGTEHTSVTPVSEGWESIQGYNADTDELLQEAFTALESTNPTPPIADSATVIDHYSLYNRSSSSSLHQLCRDDPLTVTRFPSYSSLRTPYVEHHPFRRQSSPLTELLRTSLYNSSPHSPAVSLAPWLDAHEVMPQQQSDDHLSNEATSRPRETARGECNTQAGPVMGNARSHSTSISPPISPSSIGRKKGVDQLLAFKSIDERFEAILETVEAAGFDGIDSMAAEYYTAQFKENSALQTMQSRSKSRHLPRFLDALHNDTRHWNAGDVQNYREQILRIASSILADEFLPLGEKKAASALIDETNEISPRRDSFDQAMGGAGQEQSHEEPVAESSPYADRVAERLRQIFMDPEANRLLKHERRYLQKTTPEAWSLLMELVKQTGMPQTTVSQVVCAFLSLLVTAQKSFIS